MPKYKVLVHRKVYKFLSELTDSSLKKTIKEYVELLSDYPLSLKEIDIEKIQGLKDTFRLRIGKHRVIFFVDKPNATIYVTGIKARKRAYSK